MRSFIKYLSAAFLTTLLTSMVSTCFAYIETVKLMKAPEDQKIIIKTHEQKFYELNLGLGCHHIKDFIGRHIALASSGDRHPPFGLTDASTKVQLKNGESCIIWDDKLIDYHHHHHNHHHYSF